MACTVCSMSAANVRAETKNASYCEGGKYTLRSSKMMEKFTKKRGVGASRIFGIAHRPGLKEESGHRADAIHRSCPREGSR